MGFEMVGSTQTNSPRDYVEIGAAFLIIVVILLVLIL